MSIAMILHLGDKQLVEEMSGTTETQSPTGVVTYHTPILGRDHLTDAARACVRALLGLESEATDYGRFDLEGEVGFMNLDTEGYQPYEWQWQQPAY